MGTNYTLETDKSFCVHCRRDQFLHVGKQSFGWPFLFSNMKDSAEEWFEVLREHPDAFFNEYGDKVEVEEFISRVKENKILAEQECVQSLMDQGFYLDVDGYWFSSVRDFC